MKERIKKIVIALLLTGTMAPAMAQEEVWTLDRIVRVAKDSVAEVAKIHHDYGYQQSAFKEHLATRGYQLALKMSPRYVRDKVDIAEENSLSLNTELMLEKQITQWGGTAYVATQNSWNWLLPGSSLYGIGTNGMYTGTPLRVGYRQDLFGYNGMRWEHTIQQKQLSLAENRELYEMSKVSEEAVKRFFDFIIAQEKLDVLQTNESTAEELYEIGKEKYAITSIRKDEMLSLELDLRNQKHSLSTAQVEYNNARHELLSYMNLTDNGQKIRAVIPFAKPFLSIDVQEAISRADINNPDILACDEKITETQRDLDQAKANGRWLRSSIDFSIGLQQRWNMYESSSQFHNYQYAYGGMTFTVPIIDQGLAKSRINKAQQRHDAEQSNRSIVERDLHNEVITALNTFNMQQNLLNDATETMKLADKTFQLSEYNYANGLTDISTFTLARDRKDTAHTNYLSNLKDYWESYYKLCRLTVYEW